MYSLVIPLGSGSPYNNSELRYALRSIEKHLKIYSGVFIVGEKPEWIQNVTHIPAKDLPAKKQLSIRNKILLACADPRVTDEFIFTNDDIFLLKDTCSIPNYCAGTIETVRERGARPLQEELSKKSLSNVHFDVHAPILYDKYIFPEAMREFSPDCIIKSAYCNYLRTSGVEIKDLKITVPMTEQNIWNLIEGREYFSIGDQGFTQNMLNVLNALFPNKSKYEK